MSEIVSFRVRAAQAKRKAAYTADRPIRVILEVLSDQLEQKITAIERRQAIQMIDAVVSLRDCSDERKEGEKKECENGA